MSSLHTRRFLKLQTSLLAAAFLMATGSADAQVQVLDLPTPSLTPPPLTGDIEEVGKRAFWRAGKQRAFFASTLEVGNFYVRAGGALGYGKPHWTWLGIEGSSAVTPSGGVAYGGLRLASPYIDLRGGARYTFLSGQHFIEPEETFTKDDIQRGTGPKMRLVTLEAEVAGGYPIFHGAAFGIVGVYHPLNIPDGYYVFDQTLQVVAKPDILWRARLGYLVSVDKWDMFRVGAAVEVIGNPPRGTVLVRVGPTITAFITHHLEAYGAALMPVYTHDALGIASAQLGELGFRYRFATGDRWPEIP